MYSNENGSRINFLDILVKIVFAGVFILILLWLFPKVPNMKPFYSNVFRENIKYMQEAGKGYFTTDKLPKELGKTTKLTLDEMLEQKLVLPFVDQDGNACNRFESYVSVTKEKDYYTLKTNLVCNEESDYTNEIIGCYSYCEDDKCEKKCSIEKIVEYQYKKPATKTNTSYSCPSGYTLKDKYCYKSILKDTKSAAKTSTTTRTDIVDAIKKVGEDKIVNANYILTNGQLVYYCPANWRLEGQKCVYDVAATAYTACPSGAYASKDANGNRICVYTAPTKMMDVCPTDSTLTNGKCVFTTTPTSVAACPSGSYASGNQCIYTTPVTTSSVCPSGYSDNGSNCVKYNTGSTTVAAQLVSTCNVKVFCTPQGGSNYEFIGTTTSSSCTIAYKYKVCENTYRCTSGTLSGTSCIISSNVPSYTGKVTSYTCPSGWYRDGNTCWHGVARTTTTACPTGYTASGNQCTKTVNPTSSIACPTGWYRDGNTCWTSKSGTLAYKCGSGYTLEGTTCVVRHDAYKTNKQIYTCPEGYTKTGEGTSTKCSKKVAGSITYSCKDSSYKLNGTKCSKTITGSFTEYKCDGNYKLEGDKCKLYETDKISATSKTNTSTSYSYKWSDKESLSGWTKTGKSRTVDGEEVCE